MVPAIFLISEGLSNNRVGPPAPNFQSSQNAQHGGAKVNMQSSSYSQASTSFPMPPHMMSSNPAVSAASAVAAAVNGLPPNPINLPQYLPPPATHGQKPPLPAGSANSMHQQHPPWSGGSAGSSGNLQWWKYWFFLKFDGYTRVKTT